MTDEQTTPAELAAGLGVDRMHPPAIVAFFLGLPRRVAGSLTPQRADGPGNAEGPEDPAVSTDPAVHAEEDVSGSDSVPSSSAKVDQETAQAIIGIADTLERTVERTKSVGYAATPTVDATAIVDLPPLPPRIAIQLERIETGATETARRLSGLSSAAWSADPDLLDDIRAAVVDIVGPLRTIERWADSASKVDASETASDADRTPAEDLTAP